MSVVTLSITITDGWDKDITPANYSRLSFTSPLSVTRPAIGVIGLARRHPDAGTIREAMETFKNEAVDMTGQTTYGVFTYFSKRPSE